MPKYLRMIESNYRFIDKDSHVSQPVSLKYGESSRWPSAASLGLNNSQYEAFKQALTTEFAVIQGELIF